MNVHADYWNKRSDNGVWLDGENFYTVAALPLYIHRRERIKDFITVNLRTDKKITVLDYGCGDGYYSRYVKFKFENADVHGVDLSAAMIQSAKKNAEQENLDIKYGLIDELKDERYDYIIISLVLAHIIDRTELIKTLSALRQLLTEDGKMLVVEATNNRNQYYKETIRRTEKSYIEIFDESGFFVESKKFHSYPLFNLFDGACRVLFWSVLKIKSIWAKDVETQNLNKYSLYRKLSFFFFKIFHRIDAKIENFPWKGNTFFILRSK